MGKVEVHLHLFLASALDLDDSSASCLDHPAPLPPGKELRNPLHRKLDWSQGRFWRLEERTNPLPQLGFEDRTVHFD